MYNYETSQTKIRLSQFLKEIGMNNHKFIVKMGYAATFLNSKSGISEDKLKQISECYPELNMNWLLTGKGEMMLNDIQHNDIINIFGAHKEIDMNVVLEFLNAQLKEQRKQLSEQRTELLKEVAAERELLKERFDENSALIKTLLTHVVELKQQHDKLLKLQKAV